MFDKMKLKMKKVMKNEKGMTLIELLAVLVIVAIVALIAVPAIGNIIQNSKDKSILSSAANIMDGAKLAKSDGACDFDTKACNKTNIDSYVDGVSEDYSVTYTGGVYTINYGELSNLKSDKYGGYKGTSITSTKLKEALEK